MPRQHWVVEISVHLFHMGALVPGIGRFYTRGLNSASALESETVSLILQECAGGISLAGTQSPFVAPQHPEPMTQPPWALAPLSLLPQGHIPSGRMRTTPIYHTQATMFGHLHSTDF